MKATHRLVDGAGEEVYLELNGDEVLVTMTTVGRRGTGEPGVEDELVFTHTIAYRWS
jgi:hypothetical protein